MSIYKSRLLLDEPNKKEYTFLSKGPRGTIRKVVELERYETTDIFNVLLVDEIDGVRMHDTDMTGNNDAIKVISTVVRIIEKFFIDFHGNAVFISGNTPTKKLMYQRKIYLMNKNKYIVLVNRKDGQPFQPIQRPVNTGSVYNAYLVLPA
jgi:hypothetical protein